MCSPIRLTRPGAEIIGLMITGPDDRELPRSVAVIYSSRRVMAGSTREARQAGMAAAAERDEGQEGGGGAEGRGVEGLHAIEQGRPGCARGGRRRAGRRRLRPAAIFRPRVSTSESTSAICAPSAMRMPNSRLRWLTENARTPKTPTAERSSASSAKPPSSWARKRGRATEAGGDLVHGADVGHGEILIDFGDGGL